MVKRILLLIFSLFIFTACTETKFTTVSSIIEFENLFDSALKYDIRSTDECEVGHIPSFICMGNSSNDQIVETIIITIKDKEKNIIILGDNEDVEYIFQKLTKKHYKNLFTFNGGYYEYVKQKGSDFEPEVGCDC